MDSWLLWLIAIFALGRCVYAYVIDSIVCHDGMPFLVYSWPIYPTYPQVSCVEATNIILVPLEKYTYPIRPEFISKSYNVYLYIVYAIEDYIINSYRPHMIYRIQLFHITSIDQTWNVLFDITFFTLSLAVMVQPPTRKMLYLLYNKKGYDNPFDGGRVQLTISNSPAVGWWKSTAELNVWNGSLSQPSPFLCHIFRIFPLKFWQLPFALWLKRLRVITVLPPTLPHLPILSPLVHPRRDSLTLQQNKN